MLGDALPSLLKRLPCVCGLLCLAMAAGFASAQPTGTPPKNGKAAVASRPAQSSGPRWAELSAEQRSALAPLADHWSKLNEAQQRKWLAMAQSFGRLPPAEQAKLHSRITEWAALSPQQRTEARLNFAEAQQLSPDEKKAKWEAYQALPPEEKRKLVRNAAPRTPLPAAAVRPVPSEKLAVVPKSAGDAKPARITVTPPPEPAANRPAAPAISPAPPAADAAPTVPH